jgi:integrase
MLDYSGPSAILEDSMDLTKGKLVLVKGVYWLQFSHQGKRYRKSTTFKNVREAREYAERFIIEVTTGFKVVQPGERCFYKAIDNYLKRNAKKKDAANDLNKAKVFKEAIGHYDVSEINLEKVNIVIDKLVSNATKNRYQSFAQSVLKLAYEYEWITKEVRFKKYDENETKSEVVAYVTTEEMQRLMAALPYPHDKAAAFAWATGRRRGNVYGAKWSDLDLDKKVVTTQAKDTKQKEVLVTPLTPFVLEVIESMRGHDPVYIFGDKPVTWKVWKQALAAAGLDTSLRFHGLRHTAATNLLLDGNDHYTVQKLLGWKSQAMLKRYEHLDSDMLHSLVRKSSYERRL